MTSSKRNLTLNLLLFITLLVFAGIFFYLQQTRKTGQHLPINTVDIHSIRIQHSTEIILHKQPEGWFMLSPLEGPVRNEAIEKVLTHLMLPLEGAFTANTDQLKLYGLDKPRMRVQINEQTLSFGALNTMHQKHYIKYDNVIYLAHPFLQISFDKSAEFFLETEDHE